MSDRSLTDELRGARSIGDIAAPGTYDAKYRSIRRRERVLEQRQGRVCVTDGCSQRLSIYNPAPTCWACDGGVWREPRKGEWGGGT